MAAVLQDDCPCAKPFLGGWRNTVTGLIYHNACTQTHGSGKRTRSRITQTVTLVDAVTDVVHDRAVQVRFLPDARDRIVAAVSSKEPPAREAGPLSRQDNSRILDGVVKIQRCYRAHRARATAGDGRAVRASGVSQREKVIAQAVDSQALLTGTDFAIANRRPPRTSSDFESLCNLVDRWRILETERASRTLVKPSRIAVCGLILSKEVELLRAIDTARTAIRLKREERKRRRFLDEFSRPIVWTDRQGRPILVDTLRVQRARQHRNVYTSLANEDLTVPERVDLLRDLKLIAVMHTCGQSHELVYLIDQELHLLACPGVDTSRLDWLRNRVKLSFLKLARDALQGDLEGNVSQLGWLDTGVTRLCRTCGKLLPLDKFPRERRLRSPTCVHCTFMRTRRGPRVVYESYERMLRQVRRSEAKMGCYGSLAFVVGLEVVRRLVNEIWHGRSGLSESGDLDELRLTRFRRELEWAPWNSLLLTRTEATIHDGIAEIESFYDARLLRKFCMKNLQAKVRFASISREPRNMVTPTSVED